MQEGFIVTQKEQKSQKVLWRIERFCRNNGNNYVRIRHCK